MVSHISTAHGRSLVSCVNRAAACLALVTARLMSLGDSWFIMYPWKNTFVLDG